MNQLSLFDAEIQENPSNALFLIKKYFPLDEIIPPAWIFKFYKRFGRKRDYSLSSFLWALIIQKVLTIPTTELLISILNISSELRDFCEFYKIPDKSKFSRFRTSFHNEIEEFFHSMVDLTEPICRAIDAEASKTLIIDTTGIEVYVTENNPKYFSSIQKRVESYLKSRNEQPEPAKVIAYAAKQMPKTALSNSDASYQYINGHFAYALKGAIICNKLGLVRHLKFCDSFHNTSDDLIEEKYLYDSKVFAPTLREFYSRHSSFRYKYILGDAGFDTIDNNNIAFNECGMIPLIALNPRHTVSNHPKPGVNNSCPNDPTLPLIVDRIIRENGRKPRIKLMCPKTKRTSKGYVCSCENPCSTSKLGYSHNVYLDANLRENPIIPRDSSQWNDIAGNRHIVEQVISRLKLPLSLANCYTRDSRTVKFDFFMAGAVQLIVAYVTFQAGLVNKFRCIKSFAFWILIVHIHTKGFFVMPFFSLSNRLLTFQCSILLDLQSLLLLQHCSLLLN